MLHPGSEEHTTRTVLTHLNEPRLRAARATFRSAIPFPHAVIDNLFPQSILDHIDQEFPDVPASECRRLGRRRGWHCTMQGRKGGWLKLGSGVESKWGNASRGLMRAFKSAQFRQHIEHVTGLRDLLVDESNIGSGLQQVLQNGSLQVHADNNHAVRLAERRVNCFLYLNADWKPSWGGDLTLWSRDLQRCEARIAPVQNRLVVFASHDFSYHGHPEPLNCPQGRSRRAIAIYFYTSTNVTGTSDKGMALLRPRAEVNATARRYGETTLYRAPRCDGTCAASGDCHAAPFLDGRT